MNRLEAWTVHLSTAAVGGTGLVYAWMRYLLRSSDPYAVVNHPLQPAVQHLHVLTAPLLVFAAGLVWRRHAWSHWRGGLRRRRRSGLGMLVALAPMVVSGYLVQTTVTASWHAAWVGIHLAASALWVAGWAAHGALAWRGRGSRGRDT